MFITVYKKTTFAVVLWVECRLEFIFIIKREEVGRWVGREVSVGWIVWRRGVVCECGEEGGGCRGERKLGPRFEIRVLMWLIVTLIVWEKGEGRAVRFPDSIFIVCRRFSWGHYVWLRFVSGWFCFEGWVCLKSVDLKKRFCVTLPTRLGWGIKRLVGLISTFWAWVEVDIWLRAWARLDVYIEGKYWPRIEMVCVNSYAGFYGRGEYGDR
jgi:hypothetical protein